MTERMLDDEPHVLIMVVDPGRGVPVTSAADFNTRTAAEYAGGQWRKAVSGWAHHAYVIVVPKGRALRASGVTEVPG